MANPLNDIDFPNKTEITDLSNELGYLKGISDALQSNGDQIQLTRLAATLLMNPAIKFSPEQRQKIHDASNRGDRSGVLKVIKDRRADLAVTRKHYADEVKQVDIKLAEADKKLASLKFKLKVTEELQEICRTMVIQKLGESCIHKAYQANANAELIMNDDIPYQVTDLPANPHVFVVQHNWAAAFEQAKDFAEGEFHLPYDQCAFEFRISNHRCCGIFSGDRVIVLVETTVGWVIAGCYNTADPQWTDNEDICQPLAKFIEKQVRAICIALEAEVAESQVVRAPYKLNAKREKAGKLPIFDHHIIDLSRRRVVERLPEPGDVPAEHARKRLHFVRGHFRHFNNTKTWIKWHFRGDPDLGFIDKEYRL